MGVLAAIFGLFSWLGPAFDAIPIVRTGWRWALERGVEVAVLPANWSSGRDDRISLQVAIEPSDDSTRFSFLPFIHMLFSLRLTNHRTDRKERIIGVDLAFKKRRAWFWHKTLISVPVCERAASGKLRPITNLELEPMSAPLEWQCRVEHTFDREEDRNIFPQRFEIWLVMNMVGPVRRMERVVEVMHRRGAGILAKWGPGW